MSQIATNPLLAKWTGPHGGVPAFDKMDLAQLKPALVAGIAFWQGAKALAKGAAIDRMTSSAVLAIASRLSAAPMNIPNSSPPMRAIRAASRKVEASRPARLAARDGADRRVVGMRRP